MNKENPYDVRFVNPNSNFESLTKELRYRIQNLELDLIAVRDDELKGIAQKIYTDLCIQYFKLMKDDLTLQKMYEDEGDEDEY